MITNPAGNVATLQPIQDSTRARELASRSRIKPRSLVVAIVGAERAARAGGEDILQDAAREYLNVLRDPTHRAYPVVLQHHTQYVDPRSRIDRSGPQVLGLLPRIIVQGPQSAGAEGNCITVEGSVQSPLAVACEPIDAGASTDNRERIDASLAAPGAYASSATKRMESEASAIAARAKDDAIDELRAQVAALTASVAQLASIVAASQRGAS